MSATQPSEVPGSGASPPPSTALSVAASPASAAASAISAAASRASAAASTGAETLAEGDASGAFDEVAQAAMIRTAAGGARQRARMAMASASGRRDDLERDALALALHLDHHLAAGRELSE